MTNTAELEGQRKRLLEAIKYCTTRVEAEELQEEVLEIEKALNACPSCGSYEIDEYDDLACGNEYHEE